MYKLRFVGVLMLLALVVAACGGGGAGGGSGGVNGGGGTTQLRISVLNTPSQVIVGESVELEAVLQGDGADTAEIMWSAASNDENADAGTFSSTSERKVTWTAPSEEDLIGIKVEVVGKPLLFAHFLVRVITEPHDGSGPEPSRDCTEENPCEIENFEQLQAINERINSETGAVIGYYKLVSDIDVSGLDEQDRSFTPIGYSYSRGFSGHFDGNGRNITGVLIDTRDDEAATAGLFGTINPNGVVVDVTLLAVDVKGADLTGGLVGANQGTVKDSSVQGTVAKVIGHYSGVGGLAGHNSGVIENSEANVHVVDSVEGQVGNTFLAVGGLVGRNSGQITDSKSHGKVTASGPRHAGGLVGHNEIDGFINDSISEDTLVVEAYVNDGLSGVGGLVGFNEGDIKDSDNHGSVTGNRNVGGLVGRNEGDISRSDNFAKVIGAKGDEVLNPVAGEHVGGLVGWHGQGTIEDAGNSGEVTGETHVGGLVGWMKGVEGATTLRVTDSFNEGDVTGGAHVGGLIGFNEYEHIVGTIEHSWSTDGEILGGPYVGGLVGTNRGAIRHSYSKSNVTGTGTATGGSPVDADGTGGLVGHNHAVTNVEDSGMIEVSYSTGDVEGRDRVGGLVGNNQKGSILMSRSESDVAGDRRVGGLVGDNWHDSESAPGGSIEESYSTGNVTGTSGSEAVGGLVGWNGQYGSIVNSYSLATVDGTKNVGGLVGHNRANIDDTYSAGKVTGVNGAGGLVGSAFITAVVKRSYWDTGSSEQALSDGGTPKSPTEMQKETTFTGWDPGVWTFPEGEYPALVNNPRDL